jgi:hypothetical protein
MYVSAAAESLFSAPRRTAVWHRCGWEAPMRRPLLLIVAVSAALIAVGLATAIVFAAVEQDSARAPDSSLGASWEASAAAPAFEATASGELTGLAGSEVSYEPIPVPSPVDIDRVMAHIDALALGIGTRVAGTDGERRAADYISDELERMGYEPTRQVFPLVEGKTSQNVVAVSPGSTDGIFVVGAHFDTKGPSPGANDNGTGVAITLELARELRDMQTRPSVVFVFFGAEETIDRVSDHHHFGSRHYVESLTGAELARHEGMISVDMVGYGPDFHVRTMERGTRSLADDILAFAAERGVPMTFLKDPGRSGWSDHEAFELAGVPAAWVEWRDDPVYHTAGDVPSHLDRAKVETTAELLHAYLDDRLR